MSRAKNRGSIAALIEDPRELERNRKAHEKRLASIKATIDNTSPAKYPHIEKSPKKEMQRAENRKSILQGNQRLGKSIRNVKSFNTRSEPLTLNRRQQSYAERQADLERERNNRLTMTRIESVKPYYSAKEMKEEAKEREIIRKRLMRNKAALKK